MPDLSTWTVTAINAPEHAGNTIHTDAGARAQGFPAALVAGVTTYAYLTRPLVEAWGHHWLRSGGGEVRFRAPVFAGDQVAVVPTPTGHGARVEAVVAERGDGPLVTFEASRGGLAAGREAASREAGGLEAGGLEADDPGPGGRAVVRAAPDEGPADVREPLADLRVELVDRLGPGYGSRVGDDLEMYEREGIVHPAVWLAIANDVVATQLVRGPWVHTRSLVRHHGIGEVGDVVDVHSTVVDRFHRRGERAVVDVRIVRSGEPMATIEHEAIIDLDA
ncbi:MAG: MaoC family dehydratase [Actinomycetota bacterium]